MIIGIDLGGTKIAGVLATPSGKVLMDVNIPTESKKGKKAVLNNIRKAIHLLVQSKKVKINAIGIGAPGPILYDKGIVIEAPNLPGWRKVHLKEIFEREYKVPVFVDNDANCAALAEAWFGAGKNVKHFLYMTVSTGIGGGIVINNCGHIGHLEALASGTAIRKRTGIRALALELAARQGDKKALKVIQETASYLAIGIANLINIFNPEMVIIGGGLSNMRELLFKPIRKEYKKYALTLPARSVKIVRAKLGTEAGVLGAAALCL
jgi:glucokinase